MPEQTPSRAVLDLACGQMYAFRVAARGDGVTYGAAWGEATQTAVPTAVCEGE